MSLYEVLKYANGQQKEDLSKAAWEVTRCLVNAEIAAGSNFNHFFPSWLLKILCLVNVTKKPTELILFEVLFV